MAPEKWRQQSDPQETLAKMDCEVDAEGSTEKTVLGSGEQRVTVGDQGFSPLRSSESRRGSRPVAGDTP